MIGNSDTEIEFIATLETCCGFMRPSGDVTSRGGAKTEGSRCTTFVWRAGLGRSEQATRRRARFSQSSVLVVLFVISRILAGLQRHTDSQFRKPHCLPDRMN